MKTKNHKPYQSTFEDVDHIDRTSMYDSRIKEFLFIPGIGILDEIVREEEIKNE